MWAILVVSLAAVTAPKPFILIFMQGNLLLLSGMMVHNLQRPPLYKPKMVVRLRGRETPGPDIRGRRQRRPLRRPLPVWAQRGNPPSLILILKPSPTRHQTMKRLP
eukprot:6523709-Pyramimonas_sp.AAC.1